MQIHHSYTCGTTWNPQKLYVKRRCWQRTRAVFWTHTHFPCTISAERFSPLCLQGSLQQQYIILWLSHLLYKRGFYRLFPWNSPSQGWRQKKRDSTEDWCGKLCGPKHVLIFFSHTHTIYCCLHCPICICMYIYICIYYNMQKRQQWYREIRRNSPL